MDEQTKRLVEEAEARASKATPGPWAQDNDTAVLHGDPSDGEEVCAYCAYDDATFIAHARADIPDLCAKVRELDAKASEPRQRPSKKDIALLILRSIGPNPAEFMALGPDAFRDLATKIDALYVD
jgi:hypothetical protein